MRRSSCASSSGPPQCTGRREKSLVRIRPATSQLCVAHKRASRGRRHVSLLLPLLFPVPTRVLRLGRPAHSTWLSPPERVPAAPCAGMEPPEKGPASLGSQLWRWLDSSRVGETVLQYAADALQPWETPGPGASAPGEGQQASSRETVPTFQCTFQPLPLVPHGVAAHVPTAGEPDDDELFAPGTEPKVTAPPGYTWPGGSLQLRVQPHKAGDAAEVLYTVCWRSTLTQGCVAAQLHVCGNSGAGSAVGLETARDAARTPGRRLTRGRACLCSPRYTSTKGAVCRRVADFEWLRRRLVEEYDGSAIVPALFPCLRVH